MDRSAKLQNGPFRVVWAGLVSDTYSLGRQGWEIAVNQLHHMDSIEVVLHHPIHRVTLVGSMRGHTFMLYEQIREVPIQMSAVFRDDQYVVQGPDLSFADFTRVDHRPRMTMTSRFDELPMFSELFVPAPESVELIVDPDDVQSMLDRILDLQSSEMRDIRKREARRDRIESAHRNIHAQIVTLKAA